MHIYWIEGDHKYGPVWSFNGRVEAPSFSPSMKITYDGKDIESGDAVHECCHYFVKLGEEFGEPLKLERGRSYIQYCGDTTHAPLKGQTLPLPELPEHLRG